jgi:single-strand DNA-binding protein
MLIGNLGADPDVKNINGNAVCNLSVATTEKWLGKDGTKQERTEWSRVTVWGKQAENCGKFLSKGKKVYVEGKLQTRSYDKDGQKHYATDIVASNVQFLSPAGGAGGGQQDQAPGFGPEPSFDTSEEIPF